MNHSFIFLKAEITIKIPRIISETLDFYCGSFFLKRKPSPILLNVFFSKAQKNLNCPKIQLVNGINEKYTGNTIIAASG